MPTVCMTLLPVYIESTQDSTNLSNPTASDSFEKKKHFKTSIKIFKGFF